MIQRRKHNETQNFKEANNKRYIVERRFATLVRNHMLRRSRLKIGGAAKHNLFANMACNIVRLVNLLTSSIHHENQRSITV